MRFSRSAIRRGGLVLVLSVAAASRSSAALASPGLILSPTHGPPNATISFSGSGFCGGCGSVTLTFANALVASGIPVANDGSFQGTFDVPPSPAGSQRVVAAQSGGGPSVTALFFVAPNEPAPSETTPSQTNSPSGAPTPSSTGTPSQATPTSSLTPAIPSPTASISPGSQGSSSNATPWLAVGAVVVLLGIAVYMLRRSFS